jgi:hypothetical protein
VESHPRLQEILKAGWKIEEDVYAEGPLEISRFELREFLEKGESFVTGKEMLERARKLGGLTGLDSALYLLDNQEKIPEEWRNFYIFFPGALLRRSGVNLSVPFLNWYGRGWDLKLRWVGNGWRPDDRLMRLR